MWSGKRILAYKRGLVPRYVGVYLSDVSFSLRAFPGVDDVYVMVYSSCLFSVKEVKL